MFRKVPLLVGETYHIYNRGAHKYAVFTEGSDYWRFSILLYLANHSQPVLLRELLERKKHRDRFSGEMYNVPTDEALVEVLAYSLMPNHFHIVLRQKTESGISSFMKKVTVGYSMYFNTKYGHSGTLFQGRFKSSHVDTDPYFKWLFAYVHLNPISIVEPQWRENGVKNIRSAQEFLNSYRYSSYYDYYTGLRPERAILAYKETESMLDKEQDLMNMISESDGMKSLHETFEVVDRVAGKDVEKE